jgi:hypothetical protein
MRRILLWSENLASANETCLQGIFYGECFDNSEAAVCVNHLILNPQNQKYNSLAAVSRLGKNIGYFLRTE